MGEAVPDILPVLVGRFVALFYSANRSGAALFSCRRLPFTAKAKGNPCGTIIHKTLQ
jgi:hypothetical protein